ncbi:hypothetical protein [Spongiactinospora sp. 9N601]
MVAMISIASWMMMDIVVNGMMMDIFKEVVESIDKLHISLSMIDL